MASKKDIWLFSKTKNLEGELFLKVGTNLKQVEGVEKLVNIFTYQFLTEIGSDIVYKDEGTFFGGVIGGNLLPNTNKAFILLAMQGAVDIIKEGQDATTPNDETLVSVELLELIFGIDSISIKVEITSVAGNSRVIKIPTETSIQK